MSLIDSRTNVSKMFQIIKGCLEKSTQKWDACVEKSLTENVDIVCESLQNWEENAEELGSLQEMLYVLYTAASNADVAKKFIEVGISLMIEKIFDEALRNHQKGKNEWEVIEEQILDVVNALAEGLSEDRESFLLTFCPKCLELILKKQENYLHGIEVLKGCNMVMENCTLATKEKILKRTDIPGKLRSVAAKLEILGDYECQVGIIECLFRIIPRKQRMYFAEQFFRDGKILQQFMLIKDANFETDCRIFLNEFNASLNQKLVYSIPCAWAVLGDKKLVKPNDDDYDHFWVDFNTGTKRITVFCEQINDSVKESEFWETISIRNEDVKEVKIQKKNGSVNLEIIFEKPIGILFPSQSSVKGQHMQIHFPTDADVEFVVEKTLPDCCNIIESSQKASTVEFPVKIQRDFFCEVPKPAAERNARKASSPCTPLHLIQNNRKIENTETEQHMATELNKERKKDDDKDLLQNRRRKVQEDEVSLSSKASNAASPLKISSATFYSSVVGRNEHKVSTPRTPGCRKKKKVKTPVVTVTPPVKKFRCNAQKVQKNRAENEENKKEESSQPNVKQPSFKGDAFTMVEKVTAAKNVLASKSLPEKKTERTESDMEDINFDDGDAVENFGNQDSAQLDFVEESIDAQAPLVQKKALKMKLKEAKKSNLKSKCEEVVNDKESLDTRTKSDLTKEFKNIISTFARKDEKISETEDLKSNRPSKLSPNIVRPNKNNTTENVENTTSSNDERQQILTSRNNTSNSVEVKIGLTEQMDESETDSQTDSVCLVTNAGISVQSDAEETRNINSQQETAKNTDGKIKENKIFKANTENKVSNGTARSKKNPEKRQGRKRKPAKNYSNYSKQQNLSPVVEIERLDYGKFKNVYNDKELKTDKVHASEKSGQTGKHRGRPKKAAALDKKTLKRPSTGSLFSLSEKTQSYLEHGNKRDAVFHWKDSDEEGDSCSTKTTLRPSSQADQDTQEKSTESEIDVIQESQDIAKNAYECASNKSLNTDLSFKESPWYKCMPEHSKYNTKWFKTYGKVRNHQRERMRGIQCVGSSGDSPAVQKFSQSVTKTLSVQMTYSSQCVSSPRGDADIDPYIFDDNCSEYSNNMISSKEKLTKQKSAKRGGRKNSSDLVHHDKESSSWKRSRSKKVQDDHERKEWNLESCNKVSNKKGDVCNYETRMGSSLTKYWYCNPKNSVSVYQMENVCQASRENLPPKSKKSKRTERQTCRQIKSDDENNYAIICLSSPEEECDDGSMSSHMSESQNFSTSNAKSWKPTNSYSFGKETTCNGIKDVSESSADSSPVPRKKHKKRSKVLQPLDSSPTKTPNPQPKTPESILSKFRKNCQKLVEESICSEENVISSLQTPLLPISPYIERHGQNEECENREDQATSSQKSETSQESQESIESGWNPLKRKYAISFYAFELQSVLHLQEKEKNLITEEEQVRENTCQANWLRGIQTTQQYKRGDDEKENMSISVSTASSQEIESVVSEKISSFGIEIQNQMQAKKKQLENIARDVLRSLIKTCLKSHTQLKENRTKYIEEFQLRISEELKSLEKDVISLKKTEDECLVYFEEKLKEIQRHTNSQETSIQNMVAAKEIFVKQMHHSEECADKSQFKVKNSIKKELNTLKTKLISKNQQEELDNIKHCLQRSLLLDS
ncbi:synaptonemal complex protein 2-like [Saccostrea echinata]|uniref:synaptonemal complex protein 2-like n=1 Tax=Saccostrea echinata TaxID=191078 RepID=UPI002A84155F|nr:synaptonemal complex protein 2-like [Saccostrea echinata]